MLANLAQTIATDSIVTSDTLEFKQTDSLNYFLLDPSSTYAVPSYPTLNTTAHFYIAGTYLQAADLDHVRFQCRLFGALVYNETQPDVESFQPGAQWLSPSFDFDIPAIAPQTTYAITFIGERADNSELWSVDTSFHF